MAIATAADRPMFIEGEPVEASGLWIEVRSPATGALAGGCRRVARSGRPGGGGRSAVVPGRDLGGPCSRAVGRPLAACRPDRGERGRARGARDGPDRLGLQLRRDSDLPFTIDNLRFFAGAARHLEGQAAAEYSSSPPRWSARAVGVIAQVSPWNYPLWMAIWKSDRR
jgi:betaine-aldehyde dehydrogenase